MKICTSCKEEKPLSEYYNSKIYKDGKGYRCKVCDAIARKDYEKRHRRTRLSNSRKANRKSKYGLTEDDFKNLKESQRGLCGICGVRMEEYGHVKHKSNTFCVDHDHITNEVRGLLCANCNRGLGLFKDSVSNLISAIRYLRSR